VKLRRAFVGVALIAVTSCNHVGGPAAPAVHVVSHRPPSRKDIVNAALASHSVRLAAHASCDGVGTEAADSTIGDYLSGFLAEFGTGNNNWLDTTVVEARSEAGVPVWRAELIVRQSNPEDEWGWGVRFDVTQETGAVDPASFRCIGAG
jgi:hypothetical protein